MNRFLKNHYGDLSLPPEPDSTSIHGDSDLPPPLNLKELYLLKIGGEGKVQSLSPRAAEDSDRSNPYNMPHTGYQNLVTHPASITLLNQTHSLPFDSLSHILLCDKWVLTQNQDQGTKKSSLNTGRSILDFVVDSSAKYNRITNEEKDPKDPYTIIICSTRSLKQAN